MLSQYRIEHISESRGQTRKNSTAFFQRNLGRKREGPQPKQTLKACSLFRAFFLASWPLYVFYRTQIFCWDDNPSKSSVEGGSKQADLIPKFVQSIPSHVYFAHVKTFHNTGCSNSPTDLTRLLYSLEASLFCEDGGNILLWIISNHLSHYKFYNPKGDRLIPVSNFLLRKSEELIDSNHLVWYNM